MYYIILLNILKKHYFLVVSIGSLEYAMTITYLFIVRLLVYSHYFHSDAVEKFNLQKSVICIVPYILVFKFKCYLLKRVFSFHQMLWGISASYILGHHLFKFSL